jgi:membrane-bound lytic murein transglycosylase B
LSDEGSVSTEASAPEHTSSAPGSGAATARSLRGRWWKVAAVIGATLLLMASSCSWQLGTPIPDGVPPPAGDPVPKIDTYAKGRPADQLRAWAAARAPALGMPAEALEAYAYAARVAEVENPDCNLAWTTLAGIGQVESHNGTYRGAKIAPNGDITPQIRGVRLDGTNGNLEIIDNDGGHLDGDAEYARAMGPMQFIPDTWKLYGVDANNDGKISPDNFDDAALSAAGYLCWRGKDMATPRGWMNALRAYNHSDQYARTVRDWATAYANGHPL